MSASARAVSTATGGASTVAGSRPRAQARARLGVRVTDATLLALLTAGVLLVTAVPYLYGYLSAPAGKQFMGIVLNVPDTAQYLSWARESMRTVLIENKLTPEQGPPVYFNLFWLVVGRLAGALGLGLAETAQVVRPVAGAAYIAAIYWVVGLFARDRLERWVATLVAVLGGGLGWLLVVGKVLTRSAEVAFPLDLYVTEGNTFLSIMAFPLQAMAGALLLAALGLAVLAFERNSLRLGLASGMVGLVLGLQHGYDLLILYGVVGVVGVARALVATGGWSRVRPLLVGVAIGGPSLPAALYLVYITRASDIWRSALAQYGNAGVYMPSPPHLLVLMGLPLLLTLGGLLPLGRAALRGGPARFVAAEPRELLLWVWLLLGFALLYIPTDFQIKMLVAWQVPVAIFAARTVRLAALAVSGRGSWVMGGEPRFPTTHDPRPMTPRVARAAALAGALLVLAVLPTNAYLLGWRVVDLARHDAPYYLERDEVAALRWLEANTRRSDVVLSTLTLGQYVPSQSGNSAFLAHWAMTLQYYDKRAMAARFFDPATPAEYRQGLLRAYEVRYVLAGADDPRAALDQAPYLEKVFSAGSAAVYRVAAPAAAPSAAATGAAGGGA